MYIKILFTKLFGHIKLNLCSMFFFLFIYMCREVVDTVQGFQSELNHYFWFAFFDLLQALYLQAQTG